MFFGKDSSEILSLLLNEFQKNSHLSMAFSEYNSTEELLKSLEEYIFNKRYSHDTVDLVFETLSKNVQHRVFILEESLTNSPRGIIGEKYIRCTNVSKKDVKKLTTGYIILILVQFYCFLWRAVWEKNFFDQHHLVFVDMKYFFVLHQHVFVETKLLFVQRQTSYFNTKLFFVQHQIFVLDIVWNVM